MEGEKGEKEGGRGEGIASKRSNLVHVHEEDVCRSDDASAGPVDAAEEEEEEECCRTLIFGPVAMGPI